MTKDKTSIKVVFEADTMAELVASIEAELANIKRLFPSVTSAVPRTAVFGEGQAVFDATDVKGKLTEDHEDGETYLTIEPKE